MALPEDRALILSGKTIRELGIITPHEPRTNHECGLTYGESYAGYDIRLGRDVSFYHATLAVSLEHFRMPRDVIGRVCDKSSWARHFVFVQNTVIEPGWEGYLTLELTADTGRHLIIPAGTPIAQIVFERVDAECPQYEGTYQNQAMVPTKSKLDLGQFVVLPLKD